MANHFEKQYCCRWSSIDSIKNKFQVVFTVPSQINIFPIP
jgi:hypothetical protein